MKPILFPVAFCIAIAATTAAPARADVPDGAYYTRGGVTITMDVGFTAGENVAVTAISPSGWSNTVSGTPGPNHSNQHATCEDSGVMNVPTETGTAQVRVNDGRVELNVNGTWERMRRNWRMEYLMRRGTVPPGGHEEVVSLPFDANGEISFDEWRAMTFTADPTRGRAARRN